MLLKLNYICTFEYLRKLYIKKYIAIDDTINLGDKKIQGGRNFSYINVELCKICIHLSFYIENFKNFAKIL